MKRPQLCALLLSVCCGLPIEGALAIGGLTIEPPVIVRRGDCTDYGSIDAASGRSGTVCLPISRAALRIALPRVYCREATCIILSTAVVDPNAFLQMFTRAPRGAPEADEDCVVYDFADPLRGNVRAGLICLPLRVTDRIVYCSSGRCIAIDP